MSLTNNMVYSVHRIPLWVYKLAGEATWIIMAGHTDDKDQCHRSPDEIGLVWSVSSVSQYLCLDFACWVIRHFTFLHSFPHAFVGLGSRVILWHRVLPRPPRQSESRSPFSTLLCHWALVPLTGIYAVLPPDWQLLERTMSFVHPCSPGPQSTVSYC